MNKDELFKRTPTNAGKAQKPDRQNSTGTDEETDPQVLKLLEEGMRAIEELDPLMREKLRDDPAALAEWDDIMHMCDDLDEGRTENSDTSQPT